MFLEKLLESSLSIFISVTSVRHLIVMCSRIAIWENFISFTNVMELSFSLFSVGTIFLRMPLFWKFLVSFINFLLSSIFFEAKYFIIVLSLRFLILRRHSLMKRYYMNWNIFFWIYILGFLEFSHLKFCPLMTWKLLVCDSCVKFSWNHQSFLILNKIHSFVDWVRNH